MTMVTLILRLESQVQQQKENDFLFEDEEVRDSPFCMMYCYVCLNEKENKNKEEIREDIPVI